MVLTGGLVRRFGPKQDGTRLAAYSGTRLPAIWQAQAFSWWFLHLILASLADRGLPPAAGPGGFGRGLRDGWVAALGRDPMLARWLPTRTRVSPGPGVTRARVSRTAPR